MNAKFVASTLLELFKQRGTPEFVRSDNGPEFIAKNLMRVLAIAGVTARHIEPRPPQPGFLRSWRTIFCRWNYEHRTKCRMMNAECRTNTRQKSDYRMHVFILHSAF